MKHTPGFWTELDGGALLANVETIRRAAPRAKLAPVVKGNAYGHGMLRVARLLETSPHVAMLVVGTPESAIFLRKNKIKLPILLVGTWIAEQLPSLLRHNITPTIFSTECARLVNAAAKNSVVNCHLRVDTCDCGAGLDPRELPRLVASLADLPRVNIEAVYTHLFSSYTDPAATESALEKFDALFASLPQKIRRNVFRHAANSPAIFNHPRSHYQMVRPGNALYGLPFLRENGHSCPFGSHARQTDKNVRSPLKTCLTIKGRVTHIRESATPWKLGYHSRAHAARRLAIVPAGAAQAPWLFTQKNIEALVRGQRAKILSTGMEYLYLDVSKILNAQPGDEVVFLGKQGTDEITVSELMKKTSTDITLCERFGMTFES